MEVAGKMKGANTCHLRTVSFSYERTCETLKIDLEHVLIIVRSEVSGTVRAATCAYHGDGLRRTPQRPGQTLTTFIWDGSDYLEEIR